MQIPQWLVHCRSEWYIADWSLVFLTGLVSAAWRRHPVLGGLEQQGQDCLQPRAAHVPRHFEQQNARAVCPARPRLQLQLENEVWSGACREDGHWRRVLCGQYTTRQVGITFSIPAPAKQSCLFWGCASRSAWCPTDSCDDMGGSFCIDVQSALQTSICWGMPDLQARQGFAQSLSARWQEQSRQSLGQQHDDSVHCSWGQEFCQTNND